MSDPVKWLTAALTRAEEAAKAATPGPWEPKAEDPGDDEVYTVHDGEHGDLVGNPVAYVRSGTNGPDQGRTLANMQLIATFADPDVVLRLVAGARAILAEHPLKETLGIGPGFMVRPVQVCATCGGDVREDPCAYPCRTVLLLAQAWGWTEET